MVDRERLIVGDHFWTKLHHNKVFADLRELLERYTMSCILTIMNNDPMIHYMYVARMGFESLLTFYCTATCFNTKSTKQNMRSCVTINAADCLVPPCLAETFSTGVASVRVCSCASRMGEEPGDVG